MYVYDVIYVLIGYGIEWRDKIGRDMTSDLLFIYLFMTR